MDPVYWEQCAVFGESAEENRDVSVIMRNVTFVITALALLVFFACACLVSSAFVSMLYHKARVIHLERLVKNQASPPPPNYNAIPNNEEL